MLEWLVTQPQITWSFENDDNFDPLCFTPDGGGKGEREARAG
jgi:hypothetical protein